MKIQLFFLVISIAIIGIHSGELPTAFPLNKVKQLFLQFLETEKTGIDQEEGVTIGDVLEAAGLQKYSARIRRTKATRAISRPPTMASASSEVEETTTSFARRRATD